MRNRFSTAKNFATLFFCCKHLTQYAGKKVFNKKFRKNYNLLSHHLITQNQGKLIVIDFFFIVPYGGRKFLSFFLKVEVKYIFPTDCNYVPIKKTKGEYFISVQCVLIQHISILCPFFMTFLLLVFQKRFKVIDKSKHVDIYPQLEMSPFL